MDILELLTASGVELPEEKQESFKKQFFTHFKTTGEVKTLADSLSEAQGSVTELETRLASANETIKSFEELNPEELKTKIAEYEGSLENAKTAHAQELEQVKFQSWLDASIAGASPLNTNAYRAVFSSEDMELLQSSSNRNEDFAELHKKYKEENPFLFAKEGPKPVFPQAGALGEDGVSAEEFKTMGYKQRAELHKTNPDLYKDLAKE